jgi:hypothetical protein
MKSLWQITLGDFFPIISMDFESAKILLIYILYAKNN